MCTVQYWELHAYRVAVDLSHLIWVSPFTYRIATLLFPLPQVLAIIILTFCFYESEDLRYLIKTESCSTCFLTAYVTEHNALFSWVEVTVRVDPCDSLEYALRVASPVGPRWRLAVLRFYFFLFLKNISLSRF